MKDESTAGGRVHSVEPPAAVPAQTGPITQEGGPFRGNGLYVVLIVLVLLSASLLAYVLTDRSYRNKGEAGVAVSPEQLYSDAISKLLDHAEDYVLVGEIDQADPNSPDFSIYGEATANGDTVVNINTATTLQKPRIEFQSVSGREYIKFSGFEDKRQLASHYTNYGPPGLQEAIASFTETANLTPHLDKWLELGAYVTDQPSASARPKPTLGGMTMQSVGDEIERDGQRLQAYEVVVTPDGLFELLGVIESRSKSPYFSGLFKSLSPSTGITNPLQLGLFIDVETQMISEISYSGRAFPDAQLMLSITQGGSTVFGVSDARAFKASVGFGAVHSKIFRSEFQFATSSADKQRIADLKGIKTALEIYKSLNGAYPERSQISINLQGFLNERMPGADHEIFKDPAGRYIGLNGSQYAYVAETAGGERSCGRFGGMCEKFFIATTLDNGQNYQLNSD